MKSDGIPILPPDMRKTKVDRGFTTLDRVWGADHRGYIKRVQAAVKAVQAITSAAVAQLDVKIVQLVKLLRGGEPVKMRSKGSVTLREVVDEVRTRSTWWSLYSRDDGVLI